MTIKICQITDSHLLADPRKTIWDLHVDDTLTQVLAQVKLENPDLILVTGDCTEEGSPAAYARLTQMMQSFKCPVYAIPGNHDDVKVFKTALGLLQVAEVALPAWQIIFLDSVLPGASYGFIAPEEFDRLDAQIDPRKSTMVVFHHNPVFVNARIEQYSLKNRAECLARLNKHANLKIVLFGHIHCAFEQQNHHIMYYGTPATSINFKFKEINADDVRVAPGFRIILLEEDGSFSSVVRYV
jgi:Icc protein